MSKKLKMKTFRVGRVPYYRNGQQYEEGALVQIPQNQEPGDGWTPVSAKEAAAAPPDAAPPDADDGDEGEGAGGKRPSELSI